MEKAPDGSKFSLLEDSHYNSQPVLDLKKFIQQSRKRH